MLLCCLLLPMLLLTYIGVYQRLFWQMAGCCSVLGGSHVVPLQKIACVVLFQSPLYDDDMTQALGDYCVLWCYHIRRLQVCPY